MSEYLTATFLILRPSMFSFRVPKAEIVLFTIKGDVGIKVLDLFVKSGTCN
jgi:hypothetical protein